MSRVFRNRYFPSGTSADGKLDLSISPLNIDCARTLKIGLLNLMYQRRQQQCFATPMASTWNRLPADIVAANFVAMFKRKSLENTSLEYRATVFHASP